MATRKDIQIALDLINRVNNMNDMLDVCSMVMKDVDPETGMELRVVDKIASEREGTTQYRNTTEIDIQEVAVRKCQNAKGYYSSCNAFLKKANRQMVADSLGALGVSLLDVENDLAQMNSVATNIIVGISSKNTKQEIAEFSKEISDNVDPLVLVRRIWDM